jgi:hypothetical protein
VSLGSDVDSFVAGNARVFDDDEAKKALTLNLVNNISCIAVDEYSSMSCKLSGSNVHVVLNAGNVRIDVYVEFENHKFSFMGVDAFAYNGRYNASRVEPILKSRSTTDLLEVAADALSKYRELTDATYVDSFAPLLSRVSDPTKNQNITESDITLRVTHYDEKNSTKFFFVRSFYGIPAVGLGVEISSNGCVTSLSDSISIYRIGKTQVSVTEEQATQIALANATEYISSLGAQVARTEASPYMVTGRYGDTLLLYPQWQVMICFDKTYPGGVTGYFVNVWADTSEIDRVGPLGEYSGSSGSSVPWLLLVPPPIAASLLIALVLLKRRSKKNEPRRVALSTVQDSDAP